MVAAHQPQHPHHTFIAVFEQATLKSPNVLVLRVRDTHPTGGRHVMDNYEIRIVKRDQGLAVHRSEHISDHAAIRRGQALAEAGDQVEIWRGSQCVYSGQQNASSP